MKIRGESGSMPARMGGAASGASRGGSVKVVPARSKAVNTTMNRLSDVIVKNRKSGRLAKEMSKDVNSITKGTIKINSAPAKSANAAKKAADAKALKAANKKKK